MSKIDWTDKDSVKWFILLPSGHEGPYSLNQIAGHVQKKKLAGDVKIWAEGLEAPVTISQALSMKAEPVIEMEDILPPPVPEEEIPPIPLPEEEVTPEIPVPKTRSPFPAWAVGAGLTIVACVSAVIWYAGTKEQFNIHRMPKMSQEMKARIESENSFQGWGKKIFFKEYLPQDHSQIWLVTGSFQKCDIETTFTSIEEKLLSMKNDKVSFRSNGKLRGHVVELTSFDFMNGNRIVPGLYELDVRASNCSWDGFLPLVMNGFIQPEDEYQARTKVVLFSGGAEAFHENLQNLLKKKTDLKEREKTSAELFWEDLNQKLQTLEAISLQIEQHFLDFLDENPAEFKKNLKVMVDDYTKKFGSFLTSFVVDNEKYFNSLDSKGDSQKRNYELLVRLTAKKIGLDSMTYIEEFQGMKKTPTKKDLEKISGRIIKTYAVIKKDISEKLSQVSQDQAKSQRK